MCDRGCLVTEADEVLCNRRQHAAGIDLDSDDVRWLWLLRAQRRSDDGDDCGDHDFHGAMLPVHPQSLKRMRPRESHDSTGGTHIEDGASRSMNHFPSFVTVTFWI